MASQSIFAQLVSLACHDLDAARDGLGGRAHVAAPRLARGACRPLHRHDRCRFGADAELLDLLALPRGRGRAVRRPGARGRIRASSSTRRWRGWTGVQSRTATGRRCCSTRPGPRNRSRRSPSACGGTARSTRPTIAADGLAVAISPLADGGGAIRTGDDLKDLRRRVGRPGCRRDGTEIQPDGERLAVRLPQA